MNLEVQTSAGVAVVRLRETRLVLPQLETFRAAVKEQLDEGAKNIVINLSEVSYLDSPAHGLLFELLQLVKERGGTLKLVGLQPRVEAMASLVGVTRIFEVFPDEGRALASFAQPANGEKASAE